MGKQRRRKSKIYFGKQTQDAIIEYNNTDDNIEKNKIFSERIKYPIEKLAENVMNTFKFQYFEEPKEDVQKEVVSVILEKLHMYEEGKGKAFSYFTIVAKNYLILKNNNNYRRWNRTSLISEMPETWNPENDHFESEQNGEFKEFKDIMLEFWDKNLTVIFKKKRDIQIADSILELFRRAEYIESFNKKHLYLMIRGMTNYSTHYITKVVKVMKKHQNRMLDEYLEHGHFDIKSDEFWSDETNETTDKEKESLEQSETKN